MVNFQTVKTVKQLCGIIKRMDDATVEQRSKFCSSVSKIISCDPKILDLNYCGIDFKNLASKHGFSFDEEGNCVDNLDAQECKTNGLTSFKSKEDERLFDLARAGDKFAENDFIERNMRLVYRYINSYKDSLDEDEIVSLGSWGLMSALRAFDKNMKNSIGMPVSFSSYACMAIESRLGYGLAQKQKQEKHRPVLLYDAVQTEQSSSDGGDLCLIDTVENHSVRPEQVAENNEMVETLLGFCKRVLKEREFKIIMSIVAFNKNGNEMAKELGITRQRCSEIKLRAIKKLRVALGAAGYTVCENDGELALEFQKLSANQSAAIKEELQALPKSAFTKCDVLNKKPRTDDAAVRVAKIGDLLDAVPDSEFVHNKKQLLGLYLRLFRTNRNLLGSPEVGAIGDLKKIDFIWQNCFNEDESKNLELLANIASEELYRANQKDTSYKGTNEMKRRSQVIFTNHLAFFLKNFDLAQIGVTTSGANGVDFKNDFSVIYGLADDFRLGAVNLNDKSTATKIRCLKLIDQFLDMGVDDSTKLILDEYYHKQMTFVELESVVNLNRVTISQRKGRVCKRAELYVNRELEKLAYCDEDESECVVLNK